MRLRTNGENTDKGIHGERNGTEKCGMRKLAATVVFAEHRYTEGNFEARTATYCTVKAERTATSLATARLFGWQHGIWSENTDEERWRWRKLRTEMYVKIERLLRTSTSCGAARVSLQLKPLPVLI